MMNQPTAENLMTAEVTTISPEMPVPAIARLLAEHGISAVPVVATDGSLLGLVTEADLICRLAARLDEEPSWLGALFADPANMGANFSKLDIQRSKVTDSSAHVAGGIPEQSLLPFVSPARYN